MIKVNASLMDLFNDPDEGVFLRPIITKSNENISLEEYADWLVGQKDLRGKFLQLLLILNKKTTIEEKQLQKDYEKLYEYVAKEYSLWLRLIVGQVRIVNCGEAIKEEPVIRFNYQCSKVWELLSITNKDNVRFCEQCSKEVYFCESVEEVKTNALKGNCVTVSKDLIKSISISEEYKKYECEITGEVNAFSFISKELFSK